MIFAVHELAYFGRKFIELGEVKELVENVSQLGPKADLNHSSKARKKCSRTCVDFYKSSYILTVSVMRCLACSAS